MTQAQNLSGICFFKQHCNGVRRWWRFTAKNLLIQEKRPVF